MFRPRVGIPHRPAHQQAAPGAIALTTALQIGVINLPFAQRIFDTQALTPLQLGVVILLSVTVFVVVELSKWIHRLRERARGATNAG